MPSSLPQKPASPLQATLRPLLRSRKFNEAWKTLNASTSEPARVVDERLVRGYVALQVGEAEQSLRELDGLESKLTVLSEEIGLLRARAMLSTKSALEGAALLGKERDAWAWVRAAESLARQGLSAEALEAVERGLAAENGRSTPAADRRRVWLRARRARLSEKNADPARRLEDLRWLASEPAMVEQADVLIEEALEAGQLVLEPALAQARVRRLAERGQLELVERELGKGGPASLAVTKAESAYLRGKVRLVARRDQLEGAKSLALAADLGFIDKAQLRLDAARMYVREGEVAAAERLYELVARTEPRRREEALYYAARAQAILGEPTLAEKRYKVLVERYPKGRYSNEVQYERSLNLLALGHFELARRALLRLADDSRFRANRAMLLQLSGVAALQGKKTDEALHCFRLVTKEYPFELASLFARARLAAQGSQPESTMRAAARAPAQFDTAVSERIRLLSDWGLDELAARALRTEEAKRTSPKMRDLRWLCDNYSVIGYGPRMFALSADLRERLQKSPVVTDENRWAYDCRFPRPYPAIVQSIETEMGLPADLIHSVMRQESGFDPEIVSPANAKGLMQLLGETARRIAQELDGVQPSPHLQGEPSEGLQLAEPRDNIRLGAAYLRRLLRLFDGDLILSVAAYNAGPKAVALWVARAKDIPLELFSARIPYAETRGYVERVLSNLTVYTYLQSGRATLPAVSLVLPKELKLSEELY